MKNNITLLFLFVCIGVFAQDGLTTKTVSIFKNGAGFFIKEGTIQPKNKVHTFDFKELPQASFGTFWISNPHLKEIKSFTKEYLKPREREVEFLPTSTLQLLQTNVNKKATLFLNSDNSYSGTIRGVSSALVILEQENGQWLNLPHSKVQWVTLAEKPAKMRTEKVKDTVKTNKQIVEMLFENNQKQNLDLVYFRNGIGWLPSYKIELINDNTARISMQAGVTNDAEDLKNVDLNFVVGYPNIKYFNQNDIFHSGHFNTFASRISNQRFQNVAQINDLATRAGSISYSEFSGPTNLSGSASQSPPSLTGESEEDLYFYTLKNITLKKGGRAFFQVFQEDVPYEHLYEVKLNNNHNNYYNYQRVANNDPFRNKVWHTIKLKNKTKNAWTTGAAMVLKKDGNSVRPISQDDLNYTSIEGERTLKLTIAPDVSVIDKEKETNRIVRQKLDDKYHYDIVTVAGTIELRNYKDKKIRLDVKRSIVGNMQSSEPKMLIAEQVNVNNRYNKTNEICWEIELKAGEEKKIEYQYKVYVRR